MGYHKAVITKGEYGKFSKIVEEFQELQDAHDQENVIMELVELSDLVGAIQGYLDKYYSGIITLDNLIKMANATRDAFISGDRK